MFSIFAQHGVFKCYRSHNILIARLSGSWNVECARNFAENFKQEAQPLTTQPWGHLVYLDDWELGVPEIMPIITELVTWCIANHLKKSAQVYSESMSKRYFLDKMVVDKTDNFERQVFIDQHEAIAWLKQSGFSVENHIQPREAVLS